MHIFSALFILFALFLSALSFPQSLFADSLTDRSAETKIKNNTPSGQTKTNELAASAQATLSWLGLEDKGHYSESWDESSVILKMTIPKDEWVQTQNKIRKPLGNVLSRKVLDQRVAKNPHGLPAGDYIVMFYKTSFSGKAEANELVTLYLEDGEWRVLTYQVN